MGQSVQMGGFGLGSVTIGDPPVLLWSICAILCTPANPASTPTLLRADIGVLLVEFVPVTAMRLASLLSCDADAAQDICAIVDYF